MRYLHGIVTVNRADQLRVALDSVEALMPHCFILDNSEGATRGQTGDWPVPVVRPSVPLSCAQSMNYLCRLASRRGAKCFGYQHADAQAPDGSAQRFLAALSELHASRRRWAAMLTNYDILSAYNVAAVDDIGPWDTAFPQPNYHIDKDWFYRARLKGYEIVETGIPVIHLGGGSQTIRSDPYLKFVSRIKFPMNERYYRLKWGGPPGKEVYREAWNGAAGRAGSEGPC